MDLEEQGFEVDNEGGIVHQQDNHEQSWTEYLPDFLRMATPPGSLPLFANPQTTTDDIGVGPDSRFAERIAQSLVTLRPRTFTVPINFGNPAPDDSVSDTSVSYGDDESHSIHSLSVSSRIHPTQYRTDFNGQRITMTAGKVAPMAKSNEGFFGERRASFQSRLQERNVQRTEMNDEVGVLGGAWRAVLLNLLVSSYDNVNGLQLSRILQLHLPFQTGYESYLTSQVIEALDQGDKKELKRILKIALHNRNVSRVIVQNLGLRYDFLWHWATHVHWNRLFDAVGQFPIIGITAFPATENFPSTRNHALASMFRVILGEGNWVTRTVTSGREGLITDNPNNTAQNLAAESNGFELANRNQYGTYFGRQKTNEFRLAHRLPTDESLVRTFVANPIPTMTNNGVVHVLRQLAKHWTNMLGQKWGNFAHQRMEQLDPFDTLRFHVPQVCLTLASLRGRNKWDSEVLAPVLKKLQSLRPNVNTLVAKKLVDELQDDVLLSLSGGIASIVDPFRQWLEAISMSLTRIEEDGRKVYELVQSVEMGIRLGHDLVTQVSWKVPSCEKLRLSILKHIRGEDTGEVSKMKIQSALQKTTPRDMRTLIELVRGGHHAARPAKLLLGRVKTLLQRELRREYLNRAIRDISLGPEVHGKLVRDEWYWLQEGERRSPHIYVGRIPNTDSHQFIHVESGHDRVVMLEGSITVRSYIPVAEAISRAQKMFMTIELEYGKTFSYGAFMELSFLRVALRRLVVVAELNCEEIDNARLNVLREVQRTKEDHLEYTELQEGMTYYAVAEDKVSYTPFVYSSSSQIQPGKKIVRCPPQSMLVVGGGPTGLITTIHCAEGCLSTGGEMKLQEARDAFVKGGSTFERAQVVRLDARWISMLRYHLGTVFEDVYIPASGETDSQLGNTLPTQGFVEITIKDLESSLHSEVSRLWSRGIISVYTDAKIQYDPMTNSMTKYGRNLKDGDKILRQVNMVGEETKELHPWRVTQLIYTQSLSTGDLQVGKGYGVWVRTEEQVLPFQLIDIDSDSLVYSFKSFTPMAEDFTVNAQNLPSVYPAGTDSKAHAYVDRVELHYAAGSMEGKSGVQIVSMDDIRDTKFTMDIGRTHVVEAIGKRPSSEVHIGMTTSEPYGVCCMQGLKVSMGMHNFGEKRWGSGILDDIRSQNDQNTRIVGDFTKMVRVKPIVDRMRTSISDSPDWQMHFHRLPTDAGLGQLDELEPILPKLEAACLALRNMVPSFRRQTLQTRFFETGDNYYLGMEFNREYDQWKAALCRDLVRPLHTSTDASKRRDIDALGTSFGRHIDRLWYDGCLETIRTGDVYNPGARHRVPRLYLINSYRDMRLGELPVGESFRLSDSQSEKFEVLTRVHEHSIVRNVEGYIFRMKLSTKVRREGNLTRGPDGNRESKVALATFNVGHYVNYRTVRMSGQDGYIFAFIGDEQATPHFMRYSGLTGACINAMSFNNFVTRATNGVSFEARLREYSDETNWSNGEVVQRGTGGNYGEDSFLRPGFSYKDGVAYIYSKIIEYRETKQDTRKLLSHDWLVKFSAAMIPRGLERNDSFLLGLRRSWNTAVYDHILREVELDQQLPASVASTMKTAASNLGDLGIDSHTYWFDLIKEVEMDPMSKERLVESHMSIAQGVSETLSTIISFGRKAHLESRRYSSELSRQPKPVDSLVDNFSVEAQNFANSLTQSSAFAAGALAFRLIGTEQGNTASAVLAAANIAISFGTMTNVARYKIRNEESRLLFRDEGLRKMKKTVYGLLNENDRESVDKAANPFYIALEEKTKNLIEAAHYYGYDDLEEFNMVYNMVKRKLHDRLEVERFQKYIAFKLTAEVFHENSYVQEKLVEVYRVLDELSMLLMRKIKAHSSTGEQALALFNRLNRFEMKLESSIQRGSVRHGFIKRRKFLHWDIVASIRFLYSVLCCSSARRSTPLATIHTETSGILKATRELSEMTNLALSRETQDVEALYWATRESDVASLIFLSGFFVFLASLIFTAARLFNIELLEDWAFWANLVSETGAALAIYHLCRKLIILLKLFVILIRKTRTVANIDLQDIRRIRSVTFTQIMLTITRLATASAAGVALPWFVIERGYPTLIPMASVAPIYIASGAVIAAVGATAFFFMVEYVVRFNLNPQLGPFVCELFRPEIEVIYKTVCRPDDPTIPPGEQTREAWEYTARIFLHQYRFDTVFAADRFGSVLQYIQSGMKPRNDYI